jgi:hypothetical protein
MSASPQRQVAVRGTEVEPSSLSVIRHIAPRPLATVAAWASVSGSSLWLFDAGLASTSVGLLTAGTMTGIGGLVLAYRAGTASGQILDILMPYHRLRSTRVGQNIAKALREQWPACRVERSEQDKDLIGPVHRTSGTTVTFPNGSKLIVMRSMTGMAVAFYEPSNSRSRRLSTSDERIIEAELASLQSDEIAAELRLAPGTKGHALAIAIARMCPVEATVRTHSASSDFRTAALVTETRRIPGTDVTVATGRWEDDARPHVLAVSGRRTGVLWLPAIGFASVTADDDEQRTNLALGTTPERTRIPVVAGESRADRIAAVARRALERDPGLADASGTPISALVDQHLPRLVGKHRKAQPTVRKEADEAFERGLDVVARAVGESIDGLASRDLDDLRTEVRFLESRHPERDARLSPAGTARPNDGARP